MDVGGAAPAAPMAPDAVRARLGLLTRSSQAWTPAHSEAAAGEATPNRHRLLLVVVHVQAGLPGVDHVAHVVGEAKTCLENGADGVLLCAWHLPPF